MIGCLGLIALSLPGVIVGYLLQSWAWGVGIPAVLIAIVGVIFAQRRKRRVSPQKWAEHLERHLLGTEGPYDWKESTSRPFADQKMDALRVRIAQEFKALDTPEKKEAFRRIVDALKRGEVV